MGIVIGGHRAKNGDMIGELGRHRHELPDLKPRRGRRDRLEIAPDLGRCVGLRIPSFVLRWTAEHEQHDAAFGFAERTCNPPGFKSLGKPQVIDRRGSSSEPQPP